MSLNLLRFVVSAGLVTIAPAQVWAQSEGEGADRFFAEKAEDDAAEEDSTLVQGALTSTTFVYRENGPIADNLVGGVVGVENASEFDRIFTDLRARLDARHIKGSSWDFRADARVRVAPTAQVDSNRVEKVDIPLQTGVFGDNEYQLRELFVRKFGATIDYSVGRQFVPELAATKIDGVRLDYSASDNWTYLGFAGLYPDRASRSVLDDYPKAAPTAVGGPEGSRILPLTAGGGGAYRYQRFFGSVGAVGVLPMADERLEGAPRAEQPRIFVTANGYYRRSTELDFYHFAVVDIYGSNVSDREELEGTLASIPLTNLSLGVNYKPNPALRLSAAINRVDTETLNVIAQTRLEDPAPAAGILQNNIAVQRISQQSARVGVSGAFKQSRFEVSVNGTVRNRPEIRLPQDMDMELVIPAAQAFEVTFQAVDRRSIRGHRIGGSFTRVQGFGGTNFYRTDANVARLGASKQFADGEGEYEIDLGYVASVDDGTGAACNVNMGPFQTCFGNSTVNTFSAGGLVHYRARANWLVLVGASAASQGITIIDATAGDPVEVAQPRILILTGHLRVSYRF